MGWLRKKAKQIGNVFKKIGKKLKKGLGKVAKAFGKLGPLGSLALSFILPGIGSAIGGWLGGAGANTIFGTIFKGIKLVGPPRLCGERARPGDLRAVRLVQPRVAGHRLGE